MRFIDRIRAALALTALVSLGGCATSKSVEPFQSGDIAQTPFGYFEKDPRRFDLLPPLIEKQLNYPKKPLHEPGFLVDNSEMAEIKQILDTHFIHMDDERLYLKKEDWRAPIDLMRQGDNLFGDCEDYAILARAMLLKRGIQSRLIWTKTANNLGHVITEVDGWIIDNRMSRVATKDDLLGYRFISISDKVLRPYYMWNDASMNNGRNQKSNHLAAR